MIRLRKIEPTDLPYLYQWENDATAWADGDTHNPLSQQDLRDYIASTTGDIYRDGQLRLIIEEVAEETKAVKTAGCIDLFDFDIRNRKAAMGFYIAPALRRRGIAREALRRMEEYAFNILNIRLLYALISVDNTACTALYYAAGYTRVAVLPGWTLEGDVAVWCKHNK